MTFVVDQLSIFSQEEASQKEASQKEAPDKELLFCNLSFSVENGQIVSVMGPSGSGKTTLLNFISGALEPGFSAYGKLLLDGNCLNNVAPHKRRIGLQFQDHLLFPHMTVSENLAFGLPRKYPRSERQQKVLQALDDCGLDGYKDHAPNRLSGGQRARISLMRTLLSEPALVLLDEPFSKLDTTLRGQFRQFVFDQLKRRMIPTLMVTHDLQDIPENGQIINLKNYQ